MTKDAPASSFVLECIRGSLAALKRQRGTVAIAVLATLALSMPPATREVYRILAEDHRSQWQQIALAYVTLIAAASLIWFIGRDLARQVDADALGSPGVRGWLLRWLPLGSAVVVVLGAALGLYWARSEVLALLPEATAANLRALSENQKALAELSDIFSQVRGTAERLNGGVAICVGSAIAMLMLGVSPAFRIKIGETLPAETPTRRVVRALLPVLAAVTVAVFTLATLEFPRALGVLAIFNIFLMVLSVFVGRLIWVHDRFGVPVMALALACAVVFAIMDWNDNHEVPAIASAKPFKLHIEETPGMGDAVYHVTAASTFEEWLAARPDLKAYQDRGLPYPVMLVSSAGGGLYAAQHAATVLARIQDQCPHFAQHIFAISGVSGGSLGAATFATVVGREVKPVTAPTCQGGAVRPGPIEQRVSRFLAQDFLSPVVAATLFSDFLQRFLPRPWIKKDRARVLDEAFEKAWETTYGEASGDNPFAMAVYDYWHSEGVAPAVLLNATQIGSGRRVVMAPFAPFSTNAFMAKITWLGPGNGETSQGQKYNIEQRLSSSVGISARFPWVMPAATVPTGVGKMRLVDGGYFENSGVETLQELYRVIEHVQKRSEIKFSVHMLKIFGFTGNTEKEAQADGNLAMPELSSPLLALLSTRQARADFAILRSILKLCGEGCDDTPGIMTPAYVALPWDFTTLNLDDFKLPLSWQLSALSRRLIGIQAGDPAGCALEDVDKHLEWSRAKSLDRRIAKSIGASSCVVASVCSRLSNATGDGEGNYRGGAKHPLGQEACRDWTKPSPSTARK